ncbi:MAG: sulfite exporter TauE/SafE family protein [Nitrososphaerales archaeon]
MEIIAAFILTIIAIMMGILSSIIGVGGGFIMVPLLILIYNLKAHIAIGTSIVTVFFTAISATIVYFKQKRIDWKLGALTAILTIPTAYLGAYATKFFDSRTLSGIFGIVLALVGLRIILGSGFLLKRKEKTHKNQVMLKTNNLKGWHRKLIDASGVVFDYNVNLTLGLLLLPLCGFASGFLGVGGGTMIVPVYVIVMNIPIHLAVATSLFAMIFTSTSGAWAHILLNNVSLEYAIPLIIGMVTGAQIGTRIAKRLKSKTMEFIFGLIIMIIGIFMAVTKLLA